MPRTAASVPYSARALVLRVRPLGEKDRILTLFSPEKGRFGAVARGARSPKAKLAALSQPFVLARFLLAKGRSLDLVTQAQIETAHPRLTQDALRSAWAIFGCELADHLPEESPDAEGFELLLVFLNALDGSQTNENCEAAGVWFESQWLAHQGYAPQIGFCVACDAKISPGNENGEKIWFSPQMGGTLCSNCRHNDSASEAVGVETLRALHRLSRSRRPPQSLIEAPFELGARAQGELARVLRRSTFAHFGNRIKSAPFLEDLRANLRMGG